MCGGVLVTDYDKQHSDGSHTTAYECQNSKVTYFDYEYGEYSIVYSLEKTGEESSIEYFYAPNMELAVEDNLTELFHEGKLVLTYPRRVSTKEAMRIITKVPSLLAVS